MSDYKLHLITVSSCDNCPFVRYIFGTGSCALDEDIEVDPSKLPENCRLRTAGGVLVTGRVDND